MKNAYSRIVFNHERNVVRPSVFVVLSSETKEDEFPSDQPKFE